MPRRHKTTTPKIAVNPFDRCRQAAIFPKGILTQTILVSAVHGSVASRIPGIRTQKIRWPTQIRTVLLLITVVPLKEP